MMRSLSVVIITLNEERNIARCIQSVDGLADEVIVVDSLSSDQTQAIARSLGARVVEQPFLGHIEQKNFAIDQAEHDTVLSLDADEALSTELRSSIHTVLSKWEFQGYAMNRLTNYCGTWIRHSGWYPDAKIRLFEKGKGAWTGTNPHDRFELERGASVGRIAGDLLHYSFYTVSEHLSQIEKFSTISANAKWNNGERSGILKLWFKPIAKFLKCYFLKLGILDGLAGWRIARYSAYATYLRYRKLLDLEQREI